MKLYIPTREDIDNLQVGDKALNCFGEYAEVVRIAYRDKRLRDNNHFVGVDLRFSNNATISDSYMEDELCRTVAMSNHFTSWQIDQIESVMRDLDYVLFEGSAEEIKVKFLPPKDF